MTKILFRLKYFSLVSLCCIGLLLFTLDLSAQNQKKVDSTANVCQQTQRQLGINPHQPLINRVRPASEETLTMFREAGMSPSEHLLTSSERD